MPLLLDSIFGKQNLEEVSLDDIYQVLAEFPSFSAAHVLLSKKLKLEADPAFREESMKTALYFNNPVWLQLLLEEDWNAESPALWQPAEDTPAAQQAASYVLNEVHEPDNAGHTVNDSYAEVQESVPIVNEEFSDEPRQEITVNEEYAQEAEAVHVIHQGYENAPEFVSPPYGEQEQEAGSDDQALQEIQEPVPATDHSFHDEPEDLFAGNETPVDEVDSISPVAEETTETIFNTDNPRIAESEPSGNERPILEQPVSKQPVFDQPEDTKPAEINEHESEAIPPPTVIFDTKKAESIVFAPYHMVDYFASQGIKLVLEDHPQDNFGKQLKSFTAWLKVMKKIPARGIAGKTDDGETDRIRHFAANSIEERDILTETMAEVLAKQGMYENAIALYQKLSLIYPPKSAYFASRIEQLKASLS
ncbi:MAG: hypothetical protein Q8939_09510 [Bacteroidota bacterium]|nr:hypothetical protein [Bacteroidota bacterium]